MKTENKIIQRKCIVTNAVLPKQKLLRFVKYQNKICFDSHQNLPGRGAYCKNDQQTLKILFLKKRLNRAFKMNISNDNYNLLKEEVYYGKEKSTETQK